MDVLDKLIYICNAFINGDFSIKEFQERLETIYLPDIYKDSLEKEQHNAYNRLEEIIFCCLESNHKEEGKKVAKNLIKAVMLQKQKKI